MLLKQCSLLGLFFRICALFQGQGYHLFTEPDCCTTPYQMPSRCSQLSIQSPPLVHTGMLVHTRLRSRSQLVDVNDQVCSGMFPITVVGFSRISGQGYHDAVIPPISHNVFLLRIQLAPPHIGHQFVTRSWLHMFAKGVFVQGRCKYFKDFLVLCSDESINSSLCKPTTDLLKL